MMNLAMLRRLVVALALIGCSWLAASSAHAASGHHRHHRGHYHARGVGGHRRHGVQPSGISGRLPGRSTDLTREALRFRGFGKFTPMPGNWCRDALNFWLRATGYHTDSSRMALAAVSLGPHLSVPRVGAIGVMRRRGGGHTGVIVAVVGNRVDMVSGNSKHHRVALSSYPLKRFVAFVEPRRESNGRS